MKLKTYQAWTMAEALDFAKKDLGDDAVILHTRTFERGGFFGFGRKSVVEITAARAADMPASEARPGRAKDVPAAAGARTAASAARPGAASDNLRAGAAMRAYAGGGGNARAQERLAGRAAREQLLSADGGAGRIEVDAVEAPSAVFRVVGRDERASAVNSTAPGSMPVASEPSGRAPAGPRAGMQDRADARMAVQGAGGPGPQFDTHRELHLDMDAEREKTKRLAQAMAVQLERQSRVREQASRNERATAAQAAAQAPSLLSSAVPSGSPGLTNTDADRSAVHGVAASSAVSAESTGPAQRFVLLPEKPIAGRAEQGAGGMHCVVAAVVRDAERTGPAATAAAAEAVPVTPAAIPSSTRPEATGAGSELDAIAAFVGRVLDGGAPASAAAYAPRSSSATAHVVGDSAPHPFRRASAGLGEGAAATRPDTLKADTLKADTLKADTLKADTLKADMLEADTLERMYARLIEQEVAADLAERIVREAEQECSALIEAGGGVPSSLHGHENHDSQGGHAAQFRRAVERRIAALLPTDEEHALRLLPGRDGGPRRIAFVGPTGVGKTTTLAKIAAQLTLKRGLRVGIVAADTYRIAAVDQLRTYADILGLPVEIASSPQDASRACERLGEVDVILIDTAGRSQNDRMKLSELKAFLAAAAPDETHLVLSSTASAKTLAREADAFCALGVDRVVLTKLDEAASFGTLLGIVERTGKRLSFLTHGQEVPDHIEVARGNRLAALVMGSEVR